MTRAVDFRYIVLRNGAEYTELVPASESGQSVRMNDAGEIKTSFSGTFQDPGDAVDWMTDQIRPELILDGIAYPLGIYLPATIRRRQTSSEKLVSIDAYDRCWQVKAKCAESMHYFAAGLNYLSAVGSLISEAGVTAISEEKTALTLTEGREDWNVGTSNLTIVNELLKEINYKPLWFNGNGVAMLQPEKLPKAENIDHILDDTQITSMLSDQIDQETDIYSAPNVYICICSNADKAAPMVATAENTNAQSPLSIARRGRRITQVVQIDNIASQTELQSYANRLVISSMMRGETINVETALLPGYGVGDITALRFGDLLTLTKERAWSMSLQVGGKMKHTLEKVVINVE